MLRHNWRSSAGKTLRGPESGLELFFRVLQSLDDGQGFSQQECLQRSAPGADGRETVGQIELLGGSAGMSSSS